jgi:hypothetical protein
MQSAALGSPSGINFVGADVLRSGTVAYHLNTLESARWIQEETNTKAFLLNFGGASLAKPMLLNALVEFVPLTFDPNLLTAVEAVERLSGLPPRSLLFAKFIKPKDRRHSGQSLGHAIFGFSTREAANHALVHGLFVEGKRVLARKLLPDPRRCTKCQVVGATHLAAECKSMHDVCGRCSKDHWTSKCPVTDPSLFKCHNCKEGAWPHTTADRKCPTFVAEVQKLHARTPGSKYRYFVTNDPATWELINSTERDDLYNNIQDAMWQNGDNWRGGWTAARTGNAGRGFGRLAGGPQGAGGGARMDFTMGDVGVTEKRTDNPMEVEAGGSAETRVVGEGAAGAGGVGGTVRGGGGVGRRGPRGGRGAGVGVGSAGRGTSRNTQEQGWRSEKAQGTLDGFFGESRPQSQMAQRGGSAVPWGDRPDLPDDTLPPPFPPATPGIGTPAKAPAKAPAKETQNPVTLNDK